ncbi:unnamed protein product, partial [Laminaria digitata]
STKRRVSPPTTPGTTASLLLAGALCAAHATAMRSTSPSSDANPANTAKGTSGEKVLAAAAGAAGGAGGAPAGGGGGGGGDIHMNRGLRERSATSVGGSSGSSSS